MKEYKIKEGKSSTSLFILSGDIKTIVKEIPLIKEIGYGGYKKKEWLKNALIYSGVDKENGNFLKNNKNKIKELIKESLKECEKFFSDNRYIFIFPSSDKFIAERMGGVNGFTSWEKTILIFINPKNNWEDNLKSRVIHEMAHTLSNYYGTKEYNLRESLIHEGIAENFQEDISGNREPWTKAITKKEVTKILDLIYDRLDNEDSYETHGEIFFGTGKYPNWAGYTISYYLVKDFLKKRYLDKGKKINWRWVFKTKSERFREMFLTKELK